MSRREFRGRVVGPRPAAAWLMSLIGSTTLWITEQLPLWVVAVQLLAFVVSFATRLDPPSFRRSPIWLNIGMLGVTTITIRSALEGNPATISLAYFTALAQGLQLLDARPRKSEFLLVALALFQVILASNLTDSVFFPPLLVLFLASVTWTLLVHTLHVEAAEAGDPAATSLTLAPELRRMTLVATSACLVLALLLFVTLPRFRSHLITGRSGPGLAISGFSERVSLGDVGRIRSDPSVVLRIEGLDEALPEPGDAYWRGLAFDHFDGTHWSISQSEHVAARRAISGVGRFGIDLARNRDVPLSGQRIIREPVESGVVFGPGEIHRIEGPFQRLEVDRNGSLYMPGRGDERIRYTVWSAAVERDAETLQGDRASPPFEPRPGGARPAMRYLSLPDLDPRVFERGREIVAGATTDFERAWRLQETLRREGRYTDSPPPLGDDMRSPVEAFILGDLEGHCEYFASAMVVLARTQGLPSRLVNGFAGGVPNEMGGFLEVTRADAHAWVEIHFERAGWVRFDPTPPGLRLRSKEALSLWARLAQLGSAVEIWWFERIVDFDSADQIGMLRGLWSKWNRLGASAAPDAGSGVPFAEDESSRWLEEVQPMAIGVGLVLLLGLTLAALRFRGRDTPDHIPLAYRRALRLLARRGKIRTKTTSARDFARSLHEELPAAAAQAFDVITESYLAERFGGHARGALESSPHSDLEQALAVLSSTVDRMRLRNQANI